MVEREWFTSDDPAWMLRFAAGAYGALQIRPQSYSDRGARLFACACARHVWSKLGDSGRRCVEAAEEFANGRMPARSFKDTYIWEYSAIFKARNLDASLVALTAAWEPGSLVEELATPTSIRAFAACVPPRVQCDYLRCVFGSTFQESWAPSDATTRAIARSIQEERRWSDLGVLADAMEEAGHRGAALDHCRAEHHARGCWVVDHLLAEVRL